MIPTKAVAPNHDCKRKPQLQSRCSSGALPCYRSGVGGIILILVITFIFVVIASFLYIIISYRHLIIYSSCTYCIRPPGYRVSGLNELTVETPEARDGGSFVDWVTFTMCGGPAWCAMHGEDSRVFIYAFSLSILCMYTMIPYGTNYVLYRYYRNTSYLYIQTSIQDILTVKIS